MNVCLAAQVLSRSSAVAIRTYVHFGRLELSALPTADFVENVNQLFDALNSMCVSSKNKWKSLCHPNLLTCLHTLMNVLLGLVVGVLSIQLLLVL